MVDQDPLQKKSSPVCPIQGEKLKGQDETLEPLLGDKGLILQKRHGYRFSVDAILLAALVTRQQTATSGQRAVRYMDLGTGSGIVPILLAKWDPDLSGHAVEIQEPLASMAERNMRLHGLSDRLQVLCRDLKDLPSLFPKGSVDWITLNPPYRKLESGRMNPDPQKALSRHEITASLSEMCEVMGHLLCEKGRAYMIYPSSRCVSLFAHLHSGGMEPKYIRPVYPKPGEKARWVLLEAVRKGKEELLMDAPLFVQDAQGRYTDEMERIFRWEESRD